MIKFLLIVFLISYVLYKVGGFLLKMFFISLSQQKKATTQGRSTTPRDGNVNIQYSSDNKKHNPKGFEGGEYVDYEEVKD